MSVTADIRMHFTRLLDFSGREAPRAFWPWVALQFALAMPANMLAMFAMVLPAMLDGDMETLAGAIRGYLTVIAAMGLFMVAMLAAAVTRRLHDSGRSGAYGILPLPLLALGIFLFSRLLFGPIPGEAMGVDHGSLFACCFINNLVYMGTLAFLVFLLAKPSEAAENRFGTPPVQADAEVDS